MFLNQIGKDLEDYTKELTDREEREKNAITKLEIHNIQFDVKVDKDVLNMIWLLNIPLLLMGIKAFASDIYMLVNYGKPLEFKLIEYILLAILIACFVICTMLPIAMRFVSVSSVQGSVLYYNKKKYHYSQITMVKISSRKIMSVYVGKKRLFVLTKDFINYDSFVAWARKCGVMIFREPPVELDSKKITIITMLTVFIIAVVVIGLYILG